jgi:hypothetical protein
MPRRRIVIIPHLHGKVTRDGKISEPDIHWVLEKWLERHPKFQKRKIRVVRASMKTKEGMSTDLVFASVAWSEEAARYDPTEDRDLYEYWLAEKLDDR